MKKVTLTISIALFISACSSNAIHFDINEQSIKSSNFNTLQRVHIENDSLKEFYYINWVDTTNRALNRIDIKKLNKGYKVYIGWERKRLFVTAIKLSPLSKYVITNSRGDASTFKITVKTNENGDINWTSNQ